MAIRARLRRNWVRATRAGRRVLEVFHRSTLPPHLAAVARQVRAQGLTYLSPAKLDKLAHAVLAVEQAGVPGAIVEAGCALGGSAILLASARRPPRPLRIHDVFGMIPPPGKNDDADVHDRYRVIASGQSRGLKGQRYYGYETDLQQRVRGNFARAGFDVDRDGIALIAGRVEDTLVVDDAIAVAHVDVDWYDPVLCCLQRIAPRLSTGGVIVLDDYFDWSGCRKATDAFLAQTTLRFRLDKSAGSLALHRLD